MFNLLLELAISALEHQEKRGQTTFNLLLGVAGKTGTDHV